MRARRCECRGRWFKSNRVHSFHAEVAQTGRRASLRSWFMRVRVPPSAFTSRRCGGTLADTHARGACGASLLCGFDSRHRHPSLREWRKRQTREAQTFVPLRVRISPLASLAGVAQFGRRGELKPHLLTVRLRPPASIWHANAARSSRGQDAGLSSRKYEFESHTGRQKKFGAFV